MGSRGSALARRQAETVRARLQAMGETCEIEIIRTSGDRHGEVPLTALGGKALFTREIDAAVLDGQVQFAVHSLKDVPSTLPEGLLLAAVLEREDPRDALIASPGTTLASLTPGARVATGSMRRQAQLLARRPDMQVVGVRGNVDTRLRRWREGEFDALLLAAAGLKRLGHEDAIAQRLETEDFLPAGGQGALALECRVGDGATSALLRRLHSTATGAAVAAERALLRRLDCGCLAPVAAFARSEAGELALTGLVASPDGRRLVRREARSDGRNPEALGAEVAEALLIGGAAEILRDLYA